MRAKLTLATVPVARMLRMRRAKVGSSCEGSTRLKKVRLGSTPETTASAGISSPSARTTEVTRAVLDANVLDFGVGADFRAGLARGFGKRARERAEPAARKRGGADGMRVGSGAQKKNGGAAR